MYGCISDTNVMIVTNDLYRNWIYGPLNDVQTTSNTANVAKNLSLDMI